MKLKLKINKKSKSENKKEKKADKKLNKILISYATICGIGDVDYDETSEKWGFFSKGRWIYLPDNVQGRCCDLAEKITERYNSSGYPEECCIIVFKTRYESWLE